MLRVRGNPVVMPRRAYDDVRTDGPQAPLIVRNPNYSDRTSTNAEYSTLWLWVDPLQMSADFLLKTGVAECEKPRTSSATRPASNRASSFSSLSSDGARAHRTAMSDTLKLWEPGRTLSQSHASSDPEIDATASGRLPAELSLRTFKRRTG